jgi:hypothetical protein
MASSKATFGDSADGIVINASYSGTTPIVSGVIDARNYDTAAIKLITTGTGHGTWTVQDFSDYSPGGYGQVPNVGSASDITALFTVPGAIAAVTGPSNQYVQAPYMGKAFQITFTPSSGSGTCEAIVYLKSYSC